jgi:hypothetical protein
MLNASSTTALRQALYDGIKVGLEEEGWSTGQHRLL